MTTNHLQMEEVPAPGEKYSSENGQCSI